MLKRVIVKQRDQKDCGICCIESVVKYYDGFVPLEKIREDTFTTKRGTSAFHMVETLKKYGFDAYGAKIKKERLEKENIPLPVIAHVVLDNGFNHYVVVYEIRSEKVILMDPSVGKKIMSMTDFFWIFSGVMIVVYPKTSIVTYPKEQNLLLTGIAFLGNQKKELTQIFLFSVMVFFLTLIGTFFLKLELQFLNQKTESFMIAVFFFILFFFRILSMKGVLIEEKNFNKKLELKHTTSFLDHLLCLPLKTFKTREMSDYYTRFWENVDLKYLYSDVLKNLLLSLGTMSLCFIFLYLRNETFFHFYLFVSLVFFISQMYFHKRNEFLEKKLIEDKNLFSNQLLTNLETIEMNTYLSLKEKQQEKIETELICFLKSKQQKEVFYQEYTNVQFLLKETANFILIVIGIMLITKQKLELIDFFLIEGIGSYLLNAIENLSETLPKFRYYKYILQKENEFLNIEIEPDKKEKETFQAGDLELKDVSFSYDQFSYVLKDFSLSLKVGTHTLFLGNSGCGKSTLCKILTRVLKQDYGNIKIAGINIEDYNPITVREHIVYLSQRSGLIPGTIKENIVLSRPFHHQKFEEVCKLCHIEEIVEKRPLRYETVISNQENNLSGGEKQRIMLARTLLSEAEIFLLDESLSEVDEKLEKDIIKNLHIFLKGKTIIYISHKNYKNLFDEVIKLTECHERVLIS